MDLSSGGSMNNNAALPWQPQPTTHPAALQPKQSRGYGPVLASERKVARRDTSATPPGPPGLQTILKMKLSVNQSNPFSKAENIEYSTFERKPLMLSE